MKEEAIQEKSCGLVVFRETQRGVEFLLLHYPSGHWEFPKGHVEAKETEEETALREMEEETGINNLEILKGFRETIHYNFKQNGDFISKTVVFFCAKTSEKEVTISHEHQGHQWLSYKKAIDIITFDNAKNILGKVYNFLKTKQ